MKAQEIREKFANFFIKNEHEKISSSSLIPQNDPTLLFANAGMNQFKDYFTGKATPKKKRAVTIQKCVRAGGKHNDLENVGFTARHHTFFEMLGNFSFGDYFKEEAIKFAWSFLTEELKIPKEKLYVTVHDSDQEAFGIWNKIIGIPQEKIFYMGDKDNFWEMGEVGPCGPCSEIFYDHGEKYSDGTDNSKCLLLDEGRYVEIWNLVFMQFEKYKDGDEIKRRSLPKPSVDTGAGLERLSAVMQNVYWNYDTDIFTPILDELEKLTGKKYTDPKYSSSFRVVADHIRSSTMLITDGIIPSNEGRGYVLRRIIRRGIRHLNDLGLTETSFYKLVPSVFKSLGAEYKDNFLNSDLAVKLLKLEEEKFRLTLKTGLSLIQKEIKEIKKGSLFSGEEAFKLYDTYGFPLDLTELILNEHNIKLDLDKFNELMEKQRENSKRSSKFEANEDNLKYFYSIKEKFGETKFLGYTEATSKSKLIAKNNEGDYTYLIFDETPFYGESGGQIGDTGLINQKIEVLDTQKPVKNLFVHLVHLKDADSFKLNETYDLRVNIDRRNKIAHNHSATHLLQAALIKVLGDHVKQAGSRVEEDRLRFDFTHTDALKEEELIKVENLVNEAIFKSLPVVAKLMDKNEATNMGAMALFGEKYGDIVRVLTMGDFSIELCGGTHVKNTTEIGIFTILGESSLSSGIRRIEATTSIDALNFLQGKSLLLNRAKKQLGVKDELINQKIEELFSELKEKDKKINELTNKIETIKTKDIFKNPETLKNGQKLIIGELKDINPGHLKSISDNLDDHFSDTTLLLYLKEGEKVNLLLKTKSKTLKLNQFFKDSLSIINGRGGGKPDLVQGSGEIKNINLFIEKIKSYVESI